MNQSTLLGVATVGLLAALGVVHASPDPEHTEVIIVPAGDKFLRWDGQVDRTYFIQASDPNFPLERWVWMPLIESGTGIEISHEILSTDDKAFFRLWCTDDQPPTGTSLEDWDADGDGVSNQAEIETYQSNPLNGDTDGDGLLDGWEILYGLDPKDDGSTNANYGAAGDPDKDGLLNWEEQLAGTAANDPDSDDDGITDGGEVDQGTDPTDGEDTPADEWFVLSGDAPQDEVKQRTREITIPAGERRLIIIGIASEEYLDGWTDPLTAPDYNDTLSWSLQPSSGSGESGSIDVNERDVEWQVAEVVGTTLQGFSPVHIEKSLVVEAPASGPATVEITLSATNIGDGLLPSTIIAGVLNVEILPDDNQPGKTGDQIPSSLGIGGEGHYVSPKKSAEIPDDHVLLKATGIDADLFDLILEWEGGDDYSGSPMKRKVQRAAATKVPVKLKVVETGDLVDTMNVWIVWCQLVTVSDGVAGKGFFTQEVDPNAGPLARWWVVPNPANERRFTCTIQPASIITAADHPDLEGTKTKAVPGAENEFVIDGRAADEAENKWDMSRRFLIKVKNPGGILKGQLGEPVALFVNQPENAGDPVVALDTPIQFPQDPVEGNDDPPPVDPAWKDEDTNPYDARNEADQQAGLNHQVGEMASIDAPQHIALNSWGVDQREYGMIFNYQEFARVELWDGEREEGHFWFRISDYFDWHHAMEAKYSGSNARWEDNGSTAAGGHK